MGRPKELTEEERQRFIAAGYAPVEIWVPDLNNLAYRAEANRQAAAAAEADVEDRVMDWVEAVSGEAWDDI